MKKCRSPESRSAILTKNSMSAFRRWSWVLLVVAVAMNSSFAQTNVPPPTASASPPAVPTAPPSAAPQRSASDLEKLVAPIALYPDPLIASLLPASAYPLEIVQAARFVKDTNNIAKLDAQPWDDNVKAVARIPEVITQMDNNIQWTSDLGDAFINQPKELMDALQTMRTKAQESGALKTTPQQTVNVTETVVTNIVEQKSVQVTKEIIEIQPAQPDVIYVPTYNPTVVYGAAYPVAYPGYYYPPAPYYPGTVAAASIVSFGAGMAMGAWMANGCDWNNGGCWNGNFHSDVNVNRDVNRNVNRNTDRNRTANRDANRQKWQPNQNRLKNSGSTSSGAQNREARGFGSGQNGAGAARTSAGTTRAQGGANAGQNRATTPNAGRQLSPTANQRSPQTADRQTPSTANRQTPSAANRQTPSTANRQTPSTANRGTSQGASRPSTSQGSAFSSSGGAAGARQSSARGSSSFGGASRSGGGRSGGGGRGGGGRR